VCTCADLSLSASYGVHTASSFAKTNFEAAHLGARDKRGHYLQRCVLKLAEKSKVGRSSPHITMDRYSPAESTVAAARCRAQSSVSSHTSFFYLRLQPVIYKVIRSIFHSGAMR
jgi:hypothetical protein